MTTKFIDRTGMRYGRLLAIRRAGTDKNKKVTWECRCDCGKITVVPSGALATGNTSSCGCYLKDVITKHGGWKKSSYNTWRLPKKSKTGVVGVLFHNKRYYAAITVRRKKYYSKCFKTLEEAAAARKELERIHWGVA